MDKKIWIPLSFVLGVLCCAVYYYFVPSKPFPNYVDKYRYRAILNPEQFFEHTKAEGKFSECQAPKTIILCFDNAFFQHILQKYSNHPCEDVYVLTDYPSVAVAKFGMGAPLNAMRLEREIAWGVKQVIAIGSCCGLQKNISLGDIIVCEKSIRDEGTSHHYLPYSKYVYPSESLEKKFVKALEAEKKPYKLGTSLTTDGFYRVTKEEVEQYQKEGVLCVEMESAALFAVATYRKIDVISLFTMTDSYANLVWEKAIGYREKKFEILNLLFELALKVATEEK